MNNPTHPNLGDPDCSEKQPKEQAGSRARILAKVCERPWDYNFQLHRHAPSATDLVT